MTSTDLLFEPFTLNKLILPNRIVMAPMTRAKSPGQVPTDEVASYYRRRAEGGVGLILTEGTSLAHPAASGQTDVPAMFGERSLAGWANVVKQVKAAGGLIMSQLWHEGIVRENGTGPNPEVPSISPSGLAAPDKTSGQPMTDSQIADVIAGYAKSAVYARDLGFDGIEFHAAHGYLIDQFFWKGTNIRADAFGGEVEQRTRFGADIVRAVRAAAGPDFPLLLRFSQWKVQDYGAKLADTPNELERFLRPLADAGVDCFHCSTRRFWEPEFDGSDMNLAGWTKKLSGLPTITVGSVSLNEDFMESFQTMHSDMDQSHMAALIMMLERGDFDLVAIGRALIVNPDWPHVVRAGRFGDLKPYSPSVLGELH